MGIIEAQGSKRIGAFSHGPTDRKAGQLTNFHGFSLANHYSYVLVTKNLKSQFREKIKKMTVPCLISMMGMHKKVHVKVPFPVKEILRKGPTSNVF